MKIRVLIVFGTAVLIVGVLSFRACSAPPNKGKAMYEAHCGNCHGSDGMGFAMYPPVANSDYLLTNIDRFACMVFYGMNDSITVNGKSYNHPMPGNTALTSVQIANIANYILKEMNASSLSLSSEKIDQQLNNCAEN